MQPSSFLPRSVRIARVVRELPDTVTFHFDLGDAPLMFQPGQFTMLYLFGMGEVPISISGDPQRPGELVHTIRSVGSITQPMCKLKRGAVLGMRGPYGVGWPLDVARRRDVVIVAGGLGLAPLRPAILHILQHRQDYRKVAILYGTRTPEDILFIKDLGRWRRHLDVTVEVTVDRSDTAWHGHVGVVTELIRRVDFDAAQAVALVCGPEVMMRFAARALAGCGMPLDSVYVSLERNMKCAVGSCGHCQFGPTFVCKDGPVFAYERIARLLSTREV